MTCQRIQPRAKRKWRLRARRGHTAVARRRLVPWRGAVLVRAHTLPAHPALDLRGRRATGPRPAAPLPGRVRARPPLLVLRARDPVRVHDARGDVVLQAVRACNGHDPLARRRRVTAQIQRVGCWGGRDTRQRAVVRYWDGQRRVRGGVRVGPRRYVFVTLAEGISGRARRRRRADTPVCR